MNISRKRSRRMRPSVSTLEGRVLLDGNPSGLWLGQDGHDLVGPSSTLGGDGVQDIHIALSYLPGDETIAKADVQPLGDGDWQYNGPYGVWAADIVRDPSSATGDLYIDPYQVEAGRPFQIILHYADATSAAFWVTGGAADPNLRMPQDRAQLAWIGQDGRDLAGPSAAVGPDGFQDVHLSLANLSPGIAISGVAIAASGGASWAYGMNPGGLGNAEMIRNAADATKADLYFQPTSDLSGQTLTATISYGNGKTDTASIVSGHGNPSLVDPASNPTPSFVGAPAATWIGQDGQDLVGPGAARINLTNLPEGKAVVGAVLSDPDRAVFASYTGSTPSFYVDPDANPMVFQPTGPTTANLSFPPLRNEAGASLTLRLIFDDGSQAVTQVVAGATDPGLRAPQPAGTSVVARPGDDLNSLAGQYGTVHLSAGVYNLDQPLVLLRPVSILADPGVTLEFSQAADAPAWTAAIKIRAGHVTLDGFSVRFAGPIQWSPTVSYGGAVIGTTDGEDTGPSGLVVGIALTHLDLRTPPVPASSTPAQDPDLIRLTAGLDGTIAHDTLDGGTTEFIGGPWTIIDNNYIGTIANTFTWGAFAGHNTHDVTISGNTAQPQAGSGKTWRFLVLTNSGAGDVVSNNVVTDIGPRDTDTSGANAAEVILTEAYSLHFEGMPSSLGDGGLMLQIPSPQGSAASTGDEVAILSGPDAGQYRRIAQAIDSRTYLLDSPLPQGSYAVSIATGFVGETFEGNTIDSRGSSAAADLVLVGDHFGTTVKNNQFFGGAVGFKITAAPTESPVMWGWSHAPFLGTTIEGNVITDAAQGAMLAVEHSSAIKSDAGRVYFSGMLEDNTVSWSPSFLASHPNATIPGLIVGEAGAIDAGEMVISVAGNAGLSAGGTPPTMDVISATINGQPATDQSLPLPPPGPPAPSNLRLVQDSGSSASDEVTDDGRIAFDAAAGASGYEYRLSGSTTYLTVASIASFLPTGLADGANVVLIRGFDAYGTRGPDASFTFVLDTTPPIADPPSLTSANTSGTVAIASPAFNVGGDATDTIELMRGGAEVASRTGPGTLAEPSSLADGAYSYSLHRIDEAGNTSDSPALAVTVALPVAVPTTPVTSLPTSPPVVSTPPSPTPTPSPMVTPSGTWLGQDGHDDVGMSSTTGADGIADVDLALSGLRAGHTIAFIDIEGLGGGQWQYNGPPGPWKAYLAQAAGSTTANVFFEPGTVETGRPFNLTILYDDGQQANFWVQGGAFDPATKIAAPTPPTSTTPQPTAPSSPSPGTPVKSTHKVPKKPTKKLARASAKPLVKLSLAHEAKSLKAATHPSGGQAKKAR